MSSNFFCKNLQDIISYELKKESKHSISQSYCTVYDINPDRRETLVDWLISVQVSYFLKSCEKNFS